MGRILPFVAVLVSISWCGCQRAASEQRATPDAGGEEDPAVLARRYEAMTPASRMAAMSKLPLMEEQGSPAEIRALLGAARDESERDALAQAGRRAFAQQYAEVLARKQKPGTVTVTDSRNATLSVRSEHCSKFLLENFAAGESGSIAKLLGFERVG